MCARVYFRSTSIMFLSLFPFLASQATFWQLVLSFPSMTFAAMGSLPQMFSSMGGTFSWAPPASTSASAAATSNPARPVQPISTDKKHFLFFQKSTKNIQLLGNLWGEKNSLDLSEWLNEPETLL